MDIIKAARSLFFFVIESHESYSQVLSLWLNPFPLCHTAPLFSEAFKNLSASHTGALVNCSVIKENSAVLLLEEL